MVTLREEINAKWERIHELMDAQIEGQREVLRKLEEVAKFYQLKHKEEQNGK